MESVKMQALSSPLLSGTSSPAESSSSAPPSYNTFGGSKPESRRSIDEDESSPYAHPTGCEFHGLRVSAFFAWWSLTQLHFLITVVVCLFQLIVYWVVNGDLPAEIVNVGTLTIGWSAVSITSYIKGFSALFLWCIMFERRFKCSTQSIVAGRPRLFILQQSWFPTVFFFLTTTIQVCSVVHIITIFVDPNQMFLNWLADQQTDAVLFASSCALLLESAREFAMMTWALVHFIAFFFAAALSSCHFHACFPRAYTIYHQNPFNPRTLHNPLYVAFCFMMHINTDARVGNLNHNHAAIKSVLLRAHLSEPTAPVAGGQTSADDTDDEFDFEGESDMSSQGHSLIRSSDSISTMSAPDSYQHSAVLNGMPLHRPVGRTIISNDSTAAGAAVVSSMRAMSALPTRMPTAEELLDVFCTSYGSWCRFEDLANEIIIDTTHRVAKPVSDQPEPASGPATAADDDKKPAPAAEKANNTLQFNTTLPTDLLDALEQLPTWLITCAAADRIFDQLSSSPFYHVLVQRPRAELLTRMSTAPAVYAEIIVRRYFRLSDRQSLQQLLPVSSLFCNADQFAECVAFVRADSMQDFSRFKEDVLISADFANSHVRGGLAVVPDTNPAASATVNDRASSPLLYPGSTTSSPALAPISSKPLPLNSTYLKDFVPAMQPGSVAQAVFAQNISLASFWDRVQRAALEASCWQWMQQTVARVRLAIAYVSYLNVVILFEGLVHLFAFLSAFSEMTQQGLQRQEHTVRMLIRATLSIFGVFINFAPLIAPSSAHVRRPPFACCLPRRANTLVSAAPYAFMDDEEDEEPEQANTSFASVPEDAEVSASMSTSSLPPKTPIKAAEVPATPRSVARAAARSILRQRNRAPSDSSQAGATAKDASSSNALGAALMRFRAVSSGAALLARTVWIFPFSSARASMAALPSFCDTLTRFLTTGLCPDPLVLCTPPTPDRDAQAAADDNAVYPSWSASTNVASFPAPLMMPAPLVLGPKADKQQHASLASLPPPQLSASLITPSKLDQMQSAAAAAVSPAAPNLYLPLSSRSSESFHMIVPLADLLRWAAYLHIVIGVYYLGLDSDRTFPLPIHPSSDDPSEHDVPLVFRIPYMLQLLCASKTIISAAIFGTTLALWIALQPLAWRGEPKLKKESGALQSLVSTGSQCLCFVPPLLRPFRLLSDFLFRRVLPLLSVTAQASSDRAVLMTACLLGEWPSFEQCWRFSQLRFTSLQSGSTGTQVDAAEQERQKEGAEKPFSGRSSPVSADAAAQDCNGEIALRHPWVDAERKRKLHENVQRLVVFLRDRRTYANLTPNASAHRSNSSVDFAAVSAALRMAPSSPHSGQTMDWADAMVDPADLAAYDYVLNNCEALFVSDLFRASLVRQPLFCLALARDLD